MTTTTNTTNKYELTILVDESEPEDGEIETEEFKYLIGKRVA